MLDEELNTEILNSAFVSIGKLWPNIVACSCVTDYRMGHKCKLNKETTKYNRRSTPFVIS